ncbi:hypothetical protein ACIBG8_54470 [Nonomuraea sp. NPDC050556]|uniref:hypothetical protein n=1 Tax=Nonomuraea sp. NPDC050556 TaxID=3364369 RepID=UPI003790B6AF
MSDSTPDRDKPGSDDVWITSDLDEKTSTYRVKISYGQDRSIGLGPNEALRYASAVLEARIRAMHDAAVIRQLHRKLTVPLQMCGQAVAALRADRAPLNHKATRPLMLEPGVSQELEPFLAVHIDGKRVGQWDVKQAYEHALGVLEVVSAADLDAAYYRYLIGPSHGIDKGRASNMVGDLANFMEYE